MIRFLAGCIVGAIGAAYFLHHRNEWPVIDWSVSGESYVPF